MKTPAIKALGFMLPMLVIAVAVAIWNPRGDVWGTVEPPKAQCEAYDAERLSRATVVSSELYDQRKLDRLFREPQNTVSNLGYVYVGLAVWFAARRRLARSFGVACIFLGIGSGLYHASLLPEWRLWDILGVYAALFGLCGIGVSQLLRWRGTRYDSIAALMIWFGAFVAGIFRNDVRIAGFKPLDSATVVVACVTVGSVCAVLCGLVGWRDKSGRGAMDRRRYARAMTVLAVGAPVAFVGGAADRFGGFLAAPEAWVQGHALWHLFGAVALLAAYEVFSAAGFDSSVFGGGEREWGRREEGFRE